MHETAIVSGLMRIVERKAVQHGVTRVRRVRLKVGRLCAVEPQQLQSCFELFAEGTVAEGAELLIETIEVRGRCKACGIEFPIPRYRFVCPGCSGCEVEVCQGQSLYIDSLDAESVIDNNHTLEMDKSGPVTK